MTSNLPHTNANEKKLLIGKINALFGVKGWVKILSYAHPRKNILNYQPWHLKIDGKWQTLEMLDGRERGKILIAQIQNYNDIDRAKSLLGLDIYINFSQLPKLAKGQYYWDELIDFKVINQANIELGKVSNLVDTGANLLLFVKGKKEHWIPYISPFLISVHIKKKQILVDWDEDF